MLATHMRLLASWGLLVLLAALLSTTLLSCSCLAWDVLAQICNLQRPFASSQQWSCAASPTAAFKLLSTGLHLHLQVLGYGLSPVLFEPWPW